MLETGEGVPGPPFGVTLAWWREGFRLLRDDDASGLIAGMAEKRRRKAQKLAEQRGGPIEYVHDLQVEDIRESIEDHYARQVIRPKVLESIAMAYWDNLLHIEAERGTIGSSREVVQAGLGRRLGMSEGTLSRWRSGGSNADDRRLLGSVVVALRKDLGQVCFKPRPEIAWEAVRRTLESIITRESIPALRLRQDRGMNLVSESRDEDREAQISLTPRDYSLIRSLVGDPDSDGLLEPATTNSPAESSVALKRLFARLIDRRRPREKLSEAEFRSARSRIKWLIGVWARPYVLFRIGLSQGWEGSTANFAKSWEDLDAEAE